MSKASTILLRSVVRPFYRENAGSFIFVFIMMFYIVGQNDGAGLIEYHYSLIMGMLTSKIMLILVFFLWLLYARKYAGFVSRVMADPRYSFIQIYNCLEAATRFRLFFFAELLLLLPILLYSVIIIAVGFYHHFYGTVLLIVVYLLLLSFVPAILHVYRLGNPARPKLFSWEFFRRSRTRSSNYAALLLRYVFRDQKMLWLGIKIFTCGILYIIARNNTLSPSDTATVFLFFNFGIIGNGIILYRIRDLEETQLKFYRGLPVSLMTRFFQYAVVYFILLLPEFITAASLTPHHISFKVAADFTLSGFSLLLLMNSVSFLQDFTMRDFLKVVLLIYSLQYIFVATHTLHLLYPFFFVLAACLFIAGFYKFEKLR